WVATRQNNTVAGFNPPQVQEFSKGDPGRLGDGAPYLLPSGQSLYFLSGDRGGAGSSDLFVIPLVQGVGAAANEIKNLGAGVNTATDEPAPVVSASDLVLYFARGPSRRIYKSSRARATDDFGPAELVSELTTLDAGTGNVEQYPSWISPDDCRLYFVRN